MDDVSGNTSPPYESLTWYVGLRAQTREAVPGFRNDASRPFYIEVDASKVYGFGVFV